MRGIFANRWWIVFATICGLIVGGGAINVFAFGVFLKPTTTELGLGGALLPQRAAALIAEFGWRAASLGLGLAGLVVAFVPVAIFLREPPKAARAANGAPAVPLPGIAAGEAFRSGLFWGLAIAFFLDVIAINGTLTHIVALLTDRGIALQTATATLSGVGIALILGRILSGWCLDRMWGPYVAVTFFVLPMIGIALLASGMTGVVPFVGAIMLGLGIGAEVDLMAFFTGRYFGARNYAKIYGTIFGVFAFGVGIGPALSGGSFDLFRSYTPIFMVYEVLLAISCVIFLRLGPYPYPAEEPVRSEAVFKVPA